MSAHPSFIVLEGAEGAGKSTQARLLREWLREREVPHLLGREPGGTALGEAVREILLDREDLAPGPESELFLILAARAAFVREVVTPALREGRTVVADRFDLSTLAYQGYGRGLDVDRIMSMNDFAVDDVRPHLYIVLDLPADEGRRRQLRSGVPPDRMEREGEAFLDRVREGYRRLAADRSDVERVDARGREEEVQDRILEVLSRRLGGIFSEEPFPGAPG